MGAQRPPFQFQQLAAILSEGQPGIQAVHHCLAMTDTKQPSSLREGFGARTSLGHAAREYVADIKFYGDITSIATFGILLKALHSLRVATISQ